MRRTWERRSDAELLAAAAQDGDACAELYDRYEAIVVAYLMRRTGDAELTADLTAETFATALVKGGRFRPSGPAVGWLLGIARNLLLEWQRRARIDDRARRRLGVERLEVSEASLERVEALADANAMGNPVLRALEELPEAERAAVRAYVLEERPYAEVATALGISNAAVRQRVSRGLARLRSVLDFPSAPGL